MPGGGAGVLPTAAPPVGSTRGSLSGPPCVRGFCDAMPTDSATHDPDLGQLAGRRGSGMVGRIKRIPPETGDALLYGASALFALLTIYTSTNALYQVWGRMALLPFVFGALASAVLAWIVRRARRRQPGHALTQAPAPAGLAGPHRGGGLRLRRCARHPAGLRDPVALRRRRRIPPAARGGHRRGRRAGPRARAGARTTRSCGCRTRSSTTRPASRTTRASCPTSR